MICTQEIRKYEKNRTQSYSHRLRIAEDKIPHATVGSRDG